MQENAASYETYQIILGFLGTVYAALFVKISNHYIFKPKIQHFFIESIISSKTWFQFLVDFLTNLTQLTFVGYSMLILASDSSLPVMIYSDMSWCGLLLALVSFSAIQNKEQPNNWLLTAKNVTLLILTYSLILIHYSIEFYSISLGLGLIVIYFLNLVLSSIEQKFIEAMQVLFGYKLDKEIQKEYEYCGHKNNPEFLSKYFPITLDQLNQKMKNYEKELKNIKINTRKKMTENLLKMTLAVHLSSEKMIQKGRRDIKNYYGNFHGTVLNKSRKLIENRLYSKTTEQQLRKDSENKEYDSQEYDNSALFYLFPVKIFQSSKILSVLFSIIINLGLGVVIAYAVDMASNLQKGEYFHLLYGFLLLPLRPSISKQQFMNSMALSSLWKYCIYGIFLTIVCLLSSSMNSFSFDRQSKQLVFLPMIQSAAILLSARLISKQYTSYLLVIVWIGSLVSCSFFIYKFC